MKKINRNWGKKAHQKLKRAFGGKKERRSFKFVLFISLVFEST